MTAELSMFYDRIASIGLCLLGLLMQLIGLNYSGLKPPAQRLTRKSLIPIGRHRNPAAASIAVRMPTLKSLGTLAARFQPPRRTSPLPRLRVVPQ